MTNETITVEQQGSFVHDLRILYCRDRGHGGGFVPEWWRFERCGAVEGEREDAAPAGFCRAHCGRIHEPGGAAPARHDRHVLDSIECVGDWGCHDAGDGVEAPQ